MNPSPIQDNSPRPAGILPKNVQSWLLLGLAVLMVAIMWLTGGKKPPAAAKGQPSALSAPAPLEVNETKIAELQNRIQDLQREQLVAQNALAQQTRLLNDASADPARPEDTAQAIDPPPARAEDPVQTDRKRRAYAALFASNVALTFRTPASASEPQSEPRQANPESPQSSLDPNQLAQLLKETAPTTVVPAPPSRSDAPETVRERKEEEKKPAAASLLTRDAAAGKNYILFEGTILEAVLINRLEGQFAGPVQCLVSTDVYSNDRQHLLIPAGSKLVGETKKVDTFGQTRLAVFFHRVIMPDGYSVNLDQFKGLDQSGDTGLRDLVNNHYLRIFGVSLALGTLGAVSEAGTSGPLTASGGDLLRQGFAQGTAQSATQILDKFLNIMPTVTIREGHRVKVYLSGDLALPDYHNHQMPSDL